MNVPHKWEKIAFNFSTFYYSLTLTHVEPIFPVNVVYGWPFSCMFVVVSWVSFLIKPEVVPGRMALLVTLFLVLINIFNSVR